MDIHLNEMLDKAISAIPTEPLEFMRFFMARGITGRTRCPETCLLANYLASELPLADHQTVSVGVLEAFVDSRLTLDLCASRVLPTELGVRIREFDHGVYPGLIENPWGPVDG